MNKALTWALRIIPAAIVGQTLPFKFSGAAESVKLFSDLAQKTTGSTSLEPAMRIGSGVIELIAVVLILIPKHSIKGALLMIGTMFGALASHALFIGFAGYGPLPAMAGITIVASAIYLYLSKDQLTLSRSKTAQS